jgi:WD40 repeat protein
MKIFDFKQFNEIEVLNGHNNIIRCVCVLGKDMFASCGDDLSIRIWKNNKEIHNLEEHTQRINCLINLGYMSSIETRSTYMASGSKDKKIKIWNTETGKQYKKTLNLHTKSVLTMTYISDEYQLASAGADNIIIIWDWINAKGKYSLKGHTDEITCLLYLYDGLLVSGSKDTTIRIWNTVNNSKIEIKRHKHKINCLVNIIEKKMFASGSDDRTIKIWNKNGQELQSIEVDSESIISLAYLGKDLLAFGSLDKFFIEIINIENQTVVKKFHGHKSSVNSLAILNDDLLISGSSDTKIKLWKI